MLTFWGFEDEHSASGYNAGKIVKYFLDIKPQRDEMAPGEFIAGWCNGLTQREICQNI